MIYKKQTSFTKQYISLLKEYYHVTSVKSLMRSLTSDFFVSIFLFAGSGLITSVIKGLIARFFVRCGFPLLIGKRGKIIHPYNMTFGKYIWIRDDVSLMAHGELVLGNNVVIGDQSIIWTHGKGLRVGDNTGIGFRCYIAQLGGPITIGKNVLIADSVRIHSLNHKYEDTTKDILLQGYEESTIVIEDNVWIGSGAIIFDNVTIGKGSVIGANTVVTENVPSFVVFAGNPGKVVKRLK